MGAKNARPQSPGCRLTGDERFVAFKSHHLTFMNIVPSLLQPIPAEFRNLDSVNHCTSKEMPNLDSVNHCTSKTESRFGISKFGIPMGNIFCEHPVIYWY
jgi:hypothetical protein